MHKEESTLDLGTIKIHKNVIASIASLAALEIEGVRKIGKNFKMGLWEMVGRRSYSSVKVMFEKNDEVCVELPLVIRYNFNVPEVANKVQENVRNALEKMTNLTVRNINVAVQGIEKDEAASRQS
ncbi:MAG: Asp23/Gls24 family envelope stress response protein [Elusimicrobia bacterium]|nr:Asp23/Gls24 family envelope stress response protein [Elusimicrobiota bacterium]